MKLTISFNLVLFALLTACGNGNGSDDGAGAPESTTSGDASAEDTESGACTPGEENCECNGGECLTGLVCASRVCVVPPQSPTTGAADGPASDDASETGGAPSCTINGDCAAYEVCFDDGICDHAHLGVYETRVLSFSGCPDDGVGGPEIFYVAWEDDMLDHKSGISGCPAGWGNETWELGGDALTTGFVDPFVIEFWEEDAVSNDFITSICWGVGVCEPVPPQLLHDGGWIGMIGANDQYVLDVEFDLVRRQ